MKVVCEKSSEATTAFTRIAVGECFLYGGKVHLRMQEEVGDTRNAVRLCDGEQNTFTTYQHVVPVKATVTWNWE